VTAPLADPPEVAGSPLDGLGAPPAVSGLGRGIGWTYVQLGSTAAAGLITAGLILRELGPADFGVYALIVGASAFVKTLGLSLGLSVVRSAARQHSGDEDDQAEARRELATAHSVYTFVGVVAALLLGAFAFLLPALVGYTGGQRAAVVGTTLLVGVSLGMSLATSTLSGLATGRRDFRVLAVAAVTSAATSIVAVLALVGRVGLVSLGLAELASVAVNSGLLWRWARRNASWFSLRPHRVEGSHARRVMWAALPLVLLSVGGQVIATTDLFVLGAFFSPAIVGLYRIGSLLPTQAVSVLYQGYDVVLPSLAGSDDPTVQARTVAFMTRVACYAGGVGLATMALLRDDLVLLFNGRPSSLASSALLVFCGIWLTTLVAHGIGLLLIARGRQHRFVWPVLFEVVANAVATVVLIHVIGAIGAAVATLVVLGITHVLVLPFIARRELSGSGRLLAVDGWLTVAVGVVVAGAAFLTVGWMAPSSVRLVVGGLAAGALGAGAGALLLRRDGRRRLVSLLRRSPAAPAPPAAPASPAAPAC
jgi:O-antigen/teichoic acid export membrane protein